MRAVVVFCDTEYRLSWLFRPGFRHCFVCLESNGLWIQVDARFGIPYVKYLTTSDFELAAYYQRQGFNVVETEQRKRAVRFPLVVRSCTGLVMAMLCIDAWLLTPYQLYKYLKEV